MTWIIQQLAEYFSYPFVRYAAAAGLLIALSSSILGVILVLKRYSYIGDCLSHTSFAALAAAIILKLGNARLSLILPVTIVIAILILKKREQAKINSDAIISMISVTALAVGYLLMNLFTVSGNVSGDVCSSLFGSTSILTLDFSEVWICAALSTCIILFYLFFYRKIFSVIFDEDFAQASGIRVSLCSLAIAIVIAVTIVMAMEIVGSLLISALIIFPAITSMQIFHSFRSVSISSCCFAVCGTAAGLLLSILCGTPVGATIVASDAVLFCVTALSVRIFQH